MLLKKTYLVVVLLTGFIGLVNTSACRKAMDDLLSAEPGEELSGGKDATTYDFTENAFGKELPGLSNEQLNDFAVGNSFFRNNWVTAPASTTARDGLGVLFNSMSCGGCHAKDGRAAPPATPTDPLNGLLFRLSIAGTSSTGAPVPEPNYGLQLNNRAILGVTAEGHVSTSYNEVTGNYADGTTYSLRKPSYAFTNLGYGALHSSALFSPRIANQVMGLGLLEAVPEITIISFADENDINNDGISGRPNRVWNIENNRVELGRFGWKANQPTVKQQTAAAFLGDIGITSPLFPGENLTAPQLALYGGLPNGGSPEISDTNLGRTIFYMKTLAVPARRNVNKQDVLKGKQLFTQLNCSGCHKPVMQTGASSINQLNNQTIRPYTDLLLHDMGTELADNRPDFLATGTEWRTPPLWGIGLIKTVNGHSFLLHDGRARNMEEAILWHGGEALKSRNDFIKLSKAERALLLQFLESL
jgi:CxxC motif-containing protein (DUF1111 family)